MSNITGAFSGAGTAYPSGKSLLWGLCCSIFSVQCFVQPHMNLWNRGYVIPSDKNNKTKDYITDVALFEKSFGEERHYATQNLPTLSIYFSFFKMSIYRIISLHKHTSLAKRFVASILTFTCRIYTWITRLRLNNTQTEFKKKQYDEIVWLNKM